MLLCLSIFRVWQKVSRNLLFAGPVFLLTANETPERYEEMMKNKGFTLIELLIVVAIIAILAAIAVPNFLEAQVRSKVSRVRSDMRNIATALEAYAVDTNKYPSDGPPRPVPGDDTSATLTLGNELSTPIAYLSSMSIANDLFKLQRADIANSTTLNGRERYNYTNIQARADTTAFETLSRRHGMWRLYGAGPDMYVFHTGQSPATDYTDWTLINYDPTNGTISFGDIWRDQRSTETAVQE
ncbi:MAG: type pilus assembly protein PilA [Candidatus Sumerlaeota bacterium]|nr:type pilus assembly protein PilA [Candidatus Sumerlaeota bacterium]